MLLKPGRESESKTLVVHPLSPNRALKLTPTLPLTLIPFGGNSYIPNRIVTNNGCLPVATVFLENPAKIGEAFYEGTSIQMDRCAGLCTSQCEVHLR